MNVNFEGRRAVVVGGTHGVGLAIAEQLVNSGARVIVTGRNEKNAEAAACTLGTNAIALVSDVSQPQHIAELEARAREEFGSLDALLVNVGVAEFEPFSAVTEASWDKHFDINAKGAFFTAKRLIPLVGAGGGVVFTTVTAATASPGMAVYAATKGAVRAYARTMAAELVAQNVRVNTVAPGFIDTPTLGVAGASAEERAELHRIGDEVTPMKRHGTPSEVARAAVFLALEATFTTGAELQVDGGISGIDAP
ncbi:MAG TPA: SDR family oxidoreductase [Candidatus Agrococcus pullicola]|uniref:SDR family oxidoreductase n=1 Tax=Candidatus Agrococcus pullicola TaxID=2838429 RepID=A0A9D1YXT8_9MICO|nr:SDR family oxidoreductase [Candidatus Agrococcus pullicola]